MSHENKKKKLRRPLGERPYKVLFVISPEGIETEKQYFEIFNQWDGVAIKTLPRKSSAPFYVLKKMKEHLKKEGLKKFDEAWLVVDRDEWKEKDLVELYQWSLESKNHGFALSNPSFEYWLLLHFEEGARVNTKSQCLNRLKQYLPDYDKHIEAHKITKEGINHAIQRAKQQDNPPCIDWPRASAGTTVYKLIQKILDRSTQASPQLQRR